MFGLDVRGTAMSMCILVRKGKRDKLETYDYGFHLNRPWLFVNFANTHTVLLLKGSFRHGITCKSTG